MGVNKIVAGEACGWGYEFKWIIDVSSETCLQIKSMKNILIRQTLYCTKPIDTKCDQSCQVGWTSDLKCDLSGSGTDNHSDQKALGKKNSYTSQTTTIR